MQYWIGKIESKNKRISVLSKIDELEVKEIIEKLSAVKLYERINKIHKIVIENGIELYVLLNKIKKSRLVDIRKMDDPNRVILNYCSSFGMFIDVIERLLSGLGKDRLESFRKKCSELYDLKKEYRFWVNLRNYVVHYDLPFTSIREGDGETVIYCPKEHLLKFSRWKHSKKDILEMEENIDISSMIKEMNLNLSLLYLEYLFLISDKLVEAYNDLGIFSKKCGILCPIIISAKSDIELNKGNMKIINLPIISLVEAINELEKDSRIDIHFSKDYR